MRPREINYFGVLFKLYSLSANQVSILDVHHGCKSKTPNLQLHEYGLGPFCDFMIPTELENIKGLYIFVVDDNIKYVGRCLNTFKKRISEGYGHISPRNCFKGGQPTNCHINSELNKAFEKRAKVFIGIHSMDDNSEIRELEKKLLKEQKRINPNNWNIQH